jgi:hypothetical protein
VNIRQKIKQQFWQNIYPYFMKMEHFFLPFHEKKRQPYHVGWLHPNKSLADLKRHLSQRWGFGNHFVAWEDTNQVLSWRKLGSFDEQYHIRVFNDGEIRGHHEYTPESAPFRHFFADKMNPKHADFLHFLDGYIVFQKYPRKVHADHNAPNPNSEIIYTES